MDRGLADGLVAGSGVFLIVVLVIAVAWVIVPFILFGTNSRLTQLIKLHHDTLFALGKMAKKQIDIEKRLLQLLEVQRSAHNMPDPDAAHDVESFIKNADGTDGEPRL
jgi:hypothetical protein